MTSRRHIPGTLGMKELASLTTGHPLASPHAHRPHDVETMRAAICELRGRGFGDYAIAAATALSVGYVRRVLGEARGS